MSSLYNRARVSTATAGTGTMTLGAATSNAFFTFAEAGVPDGTVVSYVIEDGSNVEIGVGTYTTAGTTLSRTTVTISKIAGVAGTTKLTLSGSAIVYIDALAADITVPPSSATDRSIAVYNGTTGRAIQNQTNWGIDASGALLNDGFADGSLGGGPTQIQITGDGSAEWAGVQYSMGDNADPLGYVFAKTRGTTPTTHAILQTDDTMGVFYAYGSDGVTYQRAVNVEFKVSGTPAAGDIRGELVFQLASGGSRTERGRIGFMQIDRVQDIDLTMAINHAVYVPEDYEVSTGFFLELKAGAVLEIG